MKKVAFFGVGGLANAVLQAALERKRLAASQENYDGSVAFNARIQELLALRSAAMQANLRHTRSPVILHAGRPSDGARGDLPLLQGDMIPAGFDEGMVRMASVIGADMAKEAFEKEALDLHNVGQAAGSLVKKVRGVGTGGAGILSRGAQALSSGAKAVGQGVQGAANAVGQGVQNVASGAAQRARNVGFAVSNSARNVAGSVSQGAQNVAKNVGQQVQTARHSLAAGFEQGTGIPKPTAARVGGAISPKSFTPPTPKPVVAPGVGTSPGSINATKGSGSTNGPKLELGAKQPAPMKNSGPSPSTPQSLVPAKAPATPNAQPQWKSYSPTQGTQQGNGGPNPGAVQGKPGAPPAQVAAPVAPQRIPDRHQRAAAAPPAPAAPAAPAPAAPGAAPAAPGPGLYEQARAKLDPHINRAKADLGDGKWKPKLLGLAAVAGGAYGAYRGAQGLANWMGRAPHEHQGNEGGVVPASAVNQYGVADRNIT